MWRLPEQSRACLHAVCAALCALHPVQFPKNSWSHWIGSYASSFERRFAEETPNHFDFYRFAHIFYISRISSTYLSALILVFEFEYIRTRSMVHPFGNMYFYWLQKRVFLSFAEPQNSIHPTTGSIYWPSCRKVHSRAHNVVDAGVPEHAATGCSEAV